MTALTSSFSRHTYTHTDKIFFNSSSSTSFHLLYVTISCISITPKSQKSTVFGLENMYMVDRYALASLKVVLDGLVYDLTFYADCVSPVKLRTCDGNKVIIDEEDETCTHIKKGPM